jgi:hypothetical protein
MKIQSLTASPDAFLMNLMRQIEIADRRFERAVEVSSTIIDGDALHKEMKIETDAAYEELHDLVSQACSVPARTDEGKIAKARLFQSFNCYIDDNGSMHKDTDIMIHIAHSLSLDLAGPPLLSSAL